MKQRLNSFRGALRLAALAAVLTTFSASAETLVFFPLNEGAGKTITDTTNNLTGSLGLPQNAETDTAVVVDEAPSGAAGDRSVRTQGNGFLMADDRENKVLNITNGPITMETWIKIDPNFGRTTEGFGSYGNSYKMGLKSGQLVWTLLGVRDITNSTTPFPVDAWTHVASVWEPGVGVTFYINGEANFVENTNRARPTLHNYLSVGSEGTGNPVVASFDRFRIHNALLTPEQLDTDPATSKPAYDSTLVWYNVSETALPLQNSAQASLPLRSSVELLPQLTGPAWTNDTPSGLPGDFALSFNGANRTLIPDPNNVITLNPEDGDYTLEAWVNLPAGFTPAARMIVFSYELNPGFSLSINNNRTIHTTTFGKRDVTSTAVVPNDGQWHHIAAVHDDGLEFRFFLDGVLAATTAYTNGPGVRTTATMAIGSAIGGGNPFTGMIDRVRYSNRALTAEQLDFPAAPSDGRPELTVQLSGQNVIVSWPANATGFTLEATDSLTNPNWQTVASQSANGRFEATVPITGQARFFRIRK